MNSCIDQQEYNIHELKKIIFNVKLFDRESYNQCMNESGQNSIDKKENLNE